MFSVSCVRSDVRTSCDFVRFFPDRKLKRCATGPNQICKCRNPRFRRAWGTIRRTNLPRELDRCEFNIINVRIATIFNRASPEGRAGGEWMGPSRFGSRSAGGYFSCFCAQPIFLLPKILCVDEHFGWGNSNSERLPFRNV